MNTLFPIYVKMDQIQTLVVGGGPVGLEKLEAIFRNSPQARVHLVAEKAENALQEFIADKPTVQFSERLFTEEDLDEVDLVIMATNNPNFNTYVQELCKKKNILLNVADKPSLCDFYLGSVVQKGNLKVGISTNGKSPTMAKRLKEFLNELLPDEIDETLELMHQLRNQVKGNFQEKIRVLNAHTEQLVKK